jgi:molybdate transport system substrate-binding protein
MLIALGLAAAGCGSRGRPAGEQGGGAPSTRLTVFAAASLRDAFVEVAQAFEAAHPGVELTLNLAGSQQLAQQLRLGAPADVFASANWVQMEVAVQGGRIAPDAPQVFAQNALVVIFPHDNPAGLSRLPDLAAPGLRLVLAAPAVPAGRYAQLFLERAAQVDGFDPDFKDQVLSRVVSFEHNARAVLTKVVLGEADAGIVYRTDAAGAAAQDVGHLEIPAELNPVAEYPIAPIADSEHSEIARALVAFVRSAAGQEILHRHGFVRPSAEPASRGRRRRG